MTACLLLASLAGLFNGLLVMWSRKRAPGGPLRQGTVALAGTAAAFIAIAGFTIAFENHPAIQSVTVMILMTNWVAVLHAICPLRLPPRLLKVSVSEFKLLHAPATGVRCFGAFLRNTPLRHLGGRVFLTDEKERDPQLILSGVFRAECTHVWALAASLPWLGYWLTQGKWPSLLWGLAVQMPINIYPILHLRHVTWRLERYAARRRVNRAVEVQP